MKSIRSIRNPAEAQAMLDDKIGHLVIEGDSGGWIYVTTPVAKLNIGVPELFLLMHDLEHLEAGCLSPHDLNNVPCTPGYDAWMRQIDYEGETEDQYALITDDIWISESSVSGGEAVHEMIRDVLTGKRKRISAPHSDQPS